MKNLTFLPIVSLAVLFTVVTMASKPNQSQYYIVYGEKRLSSATWHYYYWNGTETILLYDELQMLNAVTAQGYELVGVTTCQVANDGGYGKFQEKWVFKK